jgi:hypothetical protein
MPQSVFLRFFRDGNGLINMHVVEDFKGFLNINSSHKINNVFFLVFGSHDVFLVFNDF